MTEAGVDEARVLVVDDDVVDRMAVQRALAASDVDVTVDEVQDCATAVKAILSDAYDCVFLDYLLPGGDGLMVVREARAAGVRTPIIILTGQGDEAVAVELMKAGATDYLSKGQITPDRLAQSLRNAIRVHTAELAAQRAERERANLLALEQAARAEAEAAKVRFAFLAEASTTLSESLNPTTTLNAVADLVVRNLADWCLVDVLREDGTLARLGRAHAGHGRDGEGVHVQSVFPTTPVAPCGVTRVIATGESEIVEDVDADVRRGLEADAPLRGFAHLPVRSYLTVPLSARDRTLGAITFLVTEGDRRFTATDLDLAMELARRVALAVDNARLYLEAKAAEEQHRRQLDFTRAITHHLAEGVIAVDPQGRVTFANPAASAVLGRDVADVLGRDVHAVVHGACPHAGDGDACPFPGALRRADTTRDEDDVFTRGDGTRFPASYTVSPIVTGDARVGAVLAFHDITERRRAERELESGRRQVAMSEKLSALGILVSGVAHEIRTPLTYIVNNLHLLQRQIAGADGRGKAEPLIHAALEGVDRINDLVRDLRPFAHPDPGSRVTASLDDVVAGAVQLFRVTQRGHVDVEEDLAPTPPLELDKGQVQGVVINLLSNAMEAMADGGTITVLTRPAPGGGEIEIRDEGPGLAPDVEAHMFDPFVTTKENGTGLGLAITRRVVDAHGGSIRYTTTPGEGTTFTVFLPERAPPARAGARSVDVKDGAGARRADEPRA